MSGIKLTSGGTVNNAKTRTGNDYGIEIYGGTGTVVNSGAISATALEGVGVILESAGFVTNKSGGSVSGAYGMSLRDGGAVTNAANASISGVGSGVEISGAAGTVTNSGSITASKYDAIYLGDGGWVTNSATGTISAGDSAIYIRVAIGHVTNAGNISKGGVVLGAGGTLNNTGTVASLTYVKAGSGNVTNSGTLSGGVELESGGKVANGAGATITGDYSYAAVILGENGSAFSGGGVLSNAAKAVISGRSGVYAGGSAATVTNSGSIAGLSYQKSKGAGTTRIFGDGVSLNDGGSVTNASGASITGVRYGVYVNDGAGTITNAGVIAGATVAVEFAGSGANTLTLQTGSVLTGSVVGSKATGATNALDLTGHGTASNAFLNFTTLSVKASGTWSLDDDPTIGSTTVSTGKLSLGGGLTTAMTEDAATIVSVGKGETLTLDGASTLKGTTNGSGTLAIAAGGTAIASGAAVDIAHWSILGATASLTLDEQLSYTGAFTAGSGAVIDMTATGDYFGLGGTATFSGATLEGSETIFSGSTTKISGLTVEGDAGFSNDATVTQTGLATLSGSGAAGLDNLGASTIWDITDNTGIALATGASTALNFDNDGGLFEKTGGTGVSVIATGFNNGGNVSVSSGALDFKGAVTGTGSDTISGAATLEFGSTVADTQTIDFTGGGGALDLGSASGFSGVISGFDAVGSSDSVELLGDWKITGYTQTTADEGTLTLKKGPESASLVFDGSYTKSLFDPVFSAGLTTITYT